MEFCFFLRYRFFQLFVLEVKIFQNRKKYDHIKHTQKKEGLRNEGKVSQEVKEGRKDERKEGTIGNKPLLHNHHHILYHHPKGTQ